MGDSDNLDGDGDQEHEEEEQTSSLILPQHFLHALIRPVCIRNKTITYFILSFLTFIVNCHQSCPTVGNNCITIATPCPSARLPPPPRLQQITEVFI